MTTTPTQWMDSIQVNPSSTGFQGHQQVIGLSNGNILVVFSDDSGTVGSGANRDIVGVIYDAQGNIVTSAFQVNSALNLDDEESPSIAATNDGGFYMAYEDRDASGQSIRIERFDANGNQVDWTSVQVDPGTPFVSNPSIAVDPTDNSVFVSYHWNDGNNETIRGKAFDADLNVAPGTPADGHIVRSDDTPATFDGPYDNNSAVLSNGTYVTVYREPGADIGLEFRMSDATTGANQGIFHNIPGTETNGVSDLDPEVAALTGGGFVIVWRQDDGSNDNIMFARYDAAGTLQGAVTTVVDSGNNYSDPHVIGLEDGGFFIAAYDSTADAIEGTRYDSSGAQVGTTMFNLESGITNLPDINLGLTSDGRILLTYDDPLGDIQTEIWDPRDPANIVADPGDGQITAHVTADSTVTGSSAGETIFGQAGNDHLSGGGGIDLVFGGMGNDTLAGQSGNDFLAGQIGHDRLHGGLGNDSVYGGWGDDFVFGNQGDDNLFGNQGHDSMAGGDGNDQISGNDGNDTLIGNAGSDFLAGNAGNDRVIAGWGNDAVFGGLGDDTLFGEGGNDKLDGGDGNDDLYGAIGADILAGGNGADLMRGDSGADTLAGGAGADWLVGGTQNDRLTGGADLDRFVFATGDGHDTITEFGNNNGEKISLAGVGAITSFNDLVNNHLVVAGPGGNAKIVYGNNSIVLEGISLSDIGFGKAYSADDFIF